MRAFVCFCFFFSAAALAENHPPRLEVQKTFDAAVGVEVFFSLLAQDADGDLLAFGAEGLPAGARFEPRTGDLIWTPSPEQTGTHTVTFSVSDGNETSYALVRFRVTAPMPLAIVWSPPDVAVGEDWATSLTTNRYNNGGDERWTVEGLPTGATLTGNTLSWRATDAQLGDHPITVHVVSGSERASQEAILHVRPEHEEWESYALPGVGVAGWYPLFAPEVGFATGPSFEVVVAQYVHRNDNVGPSHGRITLKADLLFPVEDPQDVVLVYAAQLALSLERNPSRSFLLPIFAVDVGGLHQRSIGDVIQVTPQLGIHLWQSRNIFITATAGYLLALPQTERLHGPRFNISGNFTFW